MARAWIELTGEQAGWGPARLRMAGLSRAVYICEVLTGSGPLVLVLTGRKLTAAELLATGGHSRHDGGLARAEPGGAAAGLPLPCPGQSCELAWRASSHALATARSYSRRSYSSSRSAQCWQ
jgi:hypothetical protein